MKNKVYITLFVAALFMSSCSKDFLDTEVTEFVSADQLTEATEKNPGLQAGTIRGLYAFMFKIYSAGTGDHDDYGQKGYDLMSDLLSGDMVLTGYNYGWYKSTAIYEFTQDYTYDENYKMWFYYYQLIYGANKVIAELGGNDAQLTSATNKAVYGQAKAIRAYAYFYLANYIGESYQPSEPLLPLYTEITPIAKGLSTTKEVYDVIVADLQSAITNLDGFQRTYRNQINQDVAKGILAYVYGAMAVQDNSLWAKVETLTSEVMGNYTLMTARQLSPMDYDKDGSVDYGQGGFNDVTSTDWMWGQNITLSNDLDLVSWWGQFDWYTYSYAAVGDTKSVNYSLYQSIPANDIRKNQFVSMHVLDGAPVDTKVYLGTNKFYAPARTFMGQRNIKTDYLYMRVAEMYLLNAEANAHMGAYPAARASLKALLDIRMSPAAVNGGTENSTAAADYLATIADSDLLDAIYLQTRIELWGEGKSYLAMKRNQATVTLSPTHLSVDLQGAQISYDDDRMSYEIPEYEILNNPNI